MLDRSQYGKFYAHQDVARKMAALRAMHDYALSAFPDLLEGVWLTEGVPDGATDEDYWYLATKDGEYDRLVRLWAAIVGEAIDYDG